MDYQPTPRSEQARKCDRCHKLMFEWLPDGPGRDICPECHQYQWVLQQALALPLANQQELIQALQERAVG